MSPDTAVSICLYGLIGVALILCLLITFSPFLIAVSRGHPNSVPILLVCLFLGWTFIGWLVALVWAFTSVESPTSVVVVNGWETRDIPMKHRKYKVKRRKYEDDYED